MGVKAKVLCHWVGEVCESAADQSCIAALGLHCGQKDRAAGHEGDPILIDLLNDFSVQAFE